MPVADTSFIVDLIRKNAGALDLYSDLQDRNIPIATTVVTVLELYRGAQRSRNRAKNVEWVRRLLKQFLILPIDEQACETYGALSALLQEKGASIGDFDEVIASIALCYDRELITRDTHFSRISGLKILPY